MSNRIVVAGVTSLYMAVPVAGFPFPYTPQSFPDWLRAEVSGAACHIADTLRTLGDDVRLCTFVGDDVAGAAIRASLGERGLSGPGVVRAPRSSLGVVLVAPDGRRAGHPYLAAVNMLEYPVEAFRRALRGADLAVLTNTAFVRPLLRHARDEGVPVAVDVHVISEVDDSYNRPWLEVADIVFCSHERLPCSPREWVARIFDRYPGCAIAAVGLGGKGCLMGLRDGTLIEVAAVAPRGVVSTSGAGDALFASFLHGWLATRNPVTALQHAVLHAGWKVGDTFPGVVSLTGEELVRLGRSHPVATVLGRWDTEAAGDALSVVTVPALRRAPERP
ncbi:carbohydrate kinase family protein [Spongiactinospora sp. TRM90649]|uniref:carbohydrate kinase family protein n=1 Tax=Spongiactinospora sp. TRM90649 TaxID=3031114 RepID=UPI0023F6B98A|nr:carbohydrate kinase family protein [Spongiactinospora sp. TRM90649]MDF5754537.1 carbohydrate kinase family protein [Spongiactinospora sp. TRM90649]